MAPPVIIRELIMFLHKARFIWKDFFTLMKRTHGWKLFINLLNLHLSGKKISLTIQNI